MKVNVLNIGSNFISCVSADVQPDEKGDPTTIRITSYGIAKSEGITEGYMTARDKFKHSVSDALKKMTGEQPDGVRDFYVSITGTHIKGKEQAVQRAWSSEMHVISPEDIEKVMESSRSISISPDYEIISIHPNEFQIDDHTEAANPLGMKARKLEMKSYVMYSESSRLENLKSALMELGITPRGFFYQPVAAGYAVMSPSDLNFGISVLIDIGHSTTDLAIWKSGSLVRARSIPIAGMHITKDIMVGLNIRNFKAAERLKLTHGIAHEDLVEDDDLIKISELKSGKSAEIPRKVLARIIYARLYEIFYHVKNEINGYRDKESTPMNVVLVGGSANIEGIEKVAQEVLNSPVSVGEVMGFTNLPQELKWTSFASTLGTIKLVVRNRMLFGGISVEKEEEKSSRMKSIFSKIKNTLKPILDEF